MGTHASSLLAACVVVIASATAQRDPVMFPIGSGNTFSRDQVIASDASSVHVAWISTERGGHHVRAASSIDGGATWTSVATSIDSAPDVSRCHDQQLVVQGSTVYAVWVDDRIGVATLWFNRSLDGGATWMTTDTRIDTAPIGSELLATPAITVSGNDVFVVWTDHRSGEWKIRGNASHDRGATWMGADVPISTVGEGSVAPQVGVSGTVVCAAWTEHGRFLGNGDVYFARSLDNGTTWTPEVRLDSGLESVGDSHSVRMSISGDDVHVAWVDGRNGLPPAGYDIYYNRSSDRGASWFATDVRLDTDAPGSNTSGLVALASAGSAVYVAWTESHPMRRGIFANWSLDGGATWRTSDFSVSGTESGYWPDIAAQGSSIYVVWHVYAADGGLDVRCNRSFDFGASWLASPSTLNTDPGQWAWASYARIAMGVDSLYVTWEQSSSVAFTIPFGALPFGIGSPGTFGVVPTLSIIGRATRGSVVCLELDRTVGGSIGAITIGFGSPSRTTFPVLGGTLLVDPDLVVPITLGGAVGNPGIGSVSVPLSLPLHPAWSGANVNFQALIIDPGAPGGVSMSNGVELWIG
ncbi:MAG: exo-alpha-sialidase [Planctomycetes bacterium]|nr:exo-alpha-sialidase [Planctomycetota bacterium]